jgi:hypothetical protein
MLGWKATVAGGSTKGGMTFLRNFSKAEWALTALFLITLPFVQARIREDGIAYYGVARSLVVDHNLQFRGDWKDQYSPTIEGRDRFGRVVTLHSSKTGHIPVHSAIGASLLWMPFIAATHGLVLTLDRLGAHIPADGFSEPYRVTLAAATSVYAFLGIWLSFRLARRFVEEQWAVLATVALWLGSSLAAYIYVDPAWSHAHSVFAVALFLWYWNRTREKRLAAQWFVLGLLSGLMAEVYFPNAAIALVVVAEAASEWFGKAQQRFDVRPALRNYALYALAILIALLPTFVIRTILLGSPLAAGAYGNQGWNWTAPALVQILFSPSQGLFTTTPMLIPAAVGLFLFPRRDAVLGRGLIAAFVALCALIAVYPFWNLGPSFGNRYFISLIPAFIPALAYLLSESARVWRDSRAVARRAWVVAAALIVWNIGLLFQWSTGLMPDVGRVYWDEVLYNQFRIVPADALHALRSRFSFHADEREEAREARPSAL